MRDSALKPLPTRGAGGGCSSGVGEELMRDSALKRYARVRLLIGESTRRRRAHARQRFETHPQSDLVRLELWSEKSSCATAL